MKRDFTYMNNIIVGTSSAIDYKYKCDNFNLGKNEPLMNVVEIIENELGLKTINDFKPMQSGDVKESYADIEYSNNLLIYKPKYTIKDGIHLFINW